MTEGLGPKSRPAASPFTPRSKTALSPRGSTHAASPSSSPEIEISISQSLPRRASSAFRQSNAQFAEKQQEEAYFADLLSYRSAAEASRAFIVVVALLMPSMCHQKDSLNAFLCKFICS